MPEEFFWHLNMTRIRVLCNSVLPRSTKTGSTKVIGLDSRLADQLTNLSQNFLFQQIQAGFVYSTIISGSQSSQTA